MNISLTPELEKFVQSKVSTGLYNNASEVVREGLRMLKEQDEVRARWRAQIDRGWLQSQAGELRGGVAAVEQVKKRARQRGKKRA